MIFKGFFVLNECGHRGSGYLKTGKIKLVFERTDGAELITIHLGRNEDIRKTARRLKRISKKLENLAIKYDRISKHTRRPEKEDTKDRQGQNETDNAAALEAEIKLYA